MYRGERFNGYTHAAGAVLAVGAAGTLIVHAVSKGDPWRMLAFSIYGVTLVLLYLASTLYHSTRGRTKEFFRKLDYISIYLVIAGSYTPFALVTLDRIWGRPLLWAVWALAVVGIVQEIFVARGARITSLFVYFFMGWIGLVAFEPLAASLTLDGLKLLITSGAIYTVGVLFYLFDDRFPTCHGIWHLFVLGGSAAHFATLFRFVA
jgi:hemolysin III